MHGFLEVEGYTMTRGVRDIPREEGRGTFQSKTYTVTERIPQPPPQGIYLSSGSRQVSKGDFPPCL